MAWGNRGHHLRQLVHHRERKRSSAALASSQGQAPVPSIIMTGDLNVTRQALKEEMGVMHFDDIEEDREMLVVGQGNMFAIADLIQDFCLDVRRTSWARFQNSEAQVQSDHAGSRRNRD